MGSRHKELSYQCQLAVFPYLTHGQKLSLQHFGKDLPIPLRRKDFRLNSMKVDIICCFAEPDVEKRFKGKIVVDSLEYTFKYISIDMFRGQIEIRCSLNPNKFKYTRDLYVAQDYFEYFMSRSKTPTRHLEIAYFNHVFTALNNLQIPSFKWITPRPQSHFPDFLTSFSEEFVFRRLELSGQCFQTLIPHRFIRGAKHLILNRPHSPDENEEVVVANYLMRDEATEQLESVQRLCSIDTFFKCCDIILKDIIKGGSFITGAYAKDSLLPENVLSIVKKRYEGSRVRMIEDQQCIVLEETDRSTVAVFENFRGANTESSDTFTVFKFAK